MSEKTFIGNSDQGWVLHNLGIVWGFHRTQAAAQKQAEEVMGRSWRQLRRDGNLFIVKATIKEGWEK